MAGQKTSEAQKRATQAYREKNREKIRKQSGKSMAKSYINNYCTLDDLNEIEQWIATRREELQGE